MVNGRYIGKKSIVPKSPYLTVSGQDKVISGVDGTPYFFRLAPEYTAGAELFGDWRSLENGTAILYDEDGSPVLELADAAVRTTYSVKSRTTLLILTQAPPA